MPDDLTLPAQVVVLPDARLGSLWQRYAVYEALHREADLCAPMSAPDLDRVLEGVALADGARVLDIGCGHGELLLRAARCAAISGVGIDESPWAISRAAATAADRPEAAGVEWWLGDARNASSAGRFDVAACVGATHIWHGFAGTVRALLDRVGVGGRIVVGDLRPVAGGRDAQLSAFAEHGIAVIDEVVSGRDGWERYRKDVEQSVEQWADHDRALSRAEVRATRDEWLAAHEKDAARLEWAVWVGVVD